MKWKRFTVLGTSLTDLVLVLPVIKLCGGIHVSPWSHPYYGAIKGYLQIKRCAQSGIEHCNLNNSRLKSATPLYRNIL